MAIRTKSLKNEGPGTEADVVRRWAEGMTWMAHPDEPMQRASHALVVDDGVWLVDPLDAEGLDGNLAALGSVAGVVVLTNSHGRHAERFAERYGVPVYVPTCFEDPASEFDAPVEPFDDELAETSFELVWTHDGTGWKEGILYRPDRRTLVVADALGTAPLFSSREGRLELFPLLQFSPPGDELGSLPVEKVLVGHGEPVFDDAGTALVEALDVTRLEATAGFVRALPTFTRVAASELRG